MDTKVNGQNIDRDWFAAHAQMLRLAGAGLCQFIAFILIITAPFNFVYGMREMFTLLLLVLGPALAAFAWYRDRHPVIKHAAPAASEPHGYKDQ
jgi:hypothetical protein